MMPQPPELDPATSPDQLALPFEMWQLALVAGIVVVLLLSALGLLIFSRIRKRSSAAAPPTREQVARGQIMELQSRAPSLRETATGLSLILRSYISVKSHDPALYETQQEFNRRADALASLPESVQSSLRELLQHMADLKYSSQSPDDSRLAEELFNQSLDLVTRIERELARQSSGKRPSTPSRPNTIPF